MYCSMFNALLIWETLIPYARLDLHFGPSSTINIFITLLSNNLYAPCLSGTVS